METPEVQQVADLSAWDWRAALREQERGIPWLARRTGRSQTTVYAYAYGTLRAPLAWLERVAQVLGVEVTEA